MFNESPADPDSVLDKWTAHVKSKKIDNFRNSELFNRHLVFNMTHPGHKYTSF